MGAPIRYKPVGYDHGMEPAHDGPYILAAEHERLMAEARNKALEEAANVAKTGWVSADYDVVGIADADTAMRLCEHIADAIRAMKG